MYSKNKLLILGLMLLFLFGCINLSNEEGTSYLNYSDDYFSIKYPENWEIEDFGQTAYGVGFYSKLESSLDEIQDGFSVEVMLKNDEFNSFEDFEDFERSILYESEEITNIEETTLGEYTALKIEIKRNDPDTPEVNYNVYYFIKDDRVFRISYGYESAKEEKYLPIFEEMLDSLEVNYEYVEVPITYESYSNGLFSLEYPSTWEMEENSYNGEPTVVFTSKLENSYDSLKEAMLIETYALGEGFNTIQDFHDFESALLYEGEEITSDETFTFKDHEAVELKTEIYDSYYGDTEKDTMIYIIYPEKNVSLRIVYLYDSKKENKYLSIFEEMVNSLEIIE